MTIVSNTKKINITIPSFRKFNPRKDVQKPSWFRFENTIFFDPDFHNFTSEELIVWIYLLSMASHRNSESVIHDPRVISAQARVSIKHVASSLEKLEELQCITVDVTQTLRRRYVHVTSSHATEETEITEETETTESIDQPIQVVEALVPISETLLLRKVNSQVQNSWIAAYPEPDWIIQEVRKAIAWETANPRSKKKDFARFMGNWLARSWDSRRIVTGGSISPKKVVDPALQKELEEIQAYTRSINA